MRVAIGKRLEYLDAKVLILLFVAAVAVYLVLTPLYTLTDASLRTGTVARPGPLTLENYEYVYTDPYFVEVFLNTMIIGGGTVFLSLLIGVPLAWLVSRTDVPAKRLFEAVSIIPLLIPPFLGAIGWIFLASPNIGIMNTFLKYLLGPQAPVINLYSFGGIIWVLSIYFVPFIFLIVSGALKSIDPALEESARSSGSGILGTARRVTLPLILPAVLSSGLLVFIRAIEAFGVPIFLGKREGIDVLATMIYDAVASFPPDYGRAAALGMSLLVVALIGAYFQRVLIGRETSRFRTIGGKGFRPKVIQLGRWRYLAFVVLLSYFLFSTVFPAAIIFINSFTKSFGFYRWDMLTFENWTALFDYPAALTGIRNSLILSLGGATLSIIFTLLISYMVVRTHIRGREFLQYIALVPIGVPAIVIGVALLWAYIASPLYGTLWILLLAYVTRYGLPFGVQATHNTVFQIHQELEESARSSGASWLRTFRNVFIPLSLPGLLAGWILLFSAFFRELSASVLLSRAGQETVAVVIFETWDTGYTGLMSAMASLSIFIVLVIVGLAVKFAKIRLVTAD